MIDEMKKSKVLLNKILPCDKARHATYGMIIFIIFAPFSIDVALGIVLLFAIGTEIVDALGVGQSDLKDALATGALPGILYAMIKYGYIGV